jgi:hypothetical protein
LIDHRGAYSSSDTKFGSDGLMKKVLDGIRPGPIPGQGSGVYSFVRAAEGSPHANSGYLGSNQELACGRFSVKVDARENGLCLEDKFLYLEFIIARPITVCL